MIRVLVVCEFSTLHGGERSWLSTLEFLRAAGVEPLVACPAGPLATTSTAQGVTVFPFEPSSASAADDRRSARRARLAELIQWARPGLVHANSVAMGRLAGPVVVEMGVPGLAHLRDMVKLGAVGVAELNLHQRLLAVSHAARAYHASQGVCDTKIEVLHNGVDTDLFRPRPRTGRLCAEPGLPREAVIVGSVGQIVQRKGLDTLVAAADRMAEVPGLHLVLIGARYSSKAEALEYEAQLHAGFARSQLAERVYWLGERQDMAELYSEFDLLVHPARQEPLGRVLLEAAACAVPIVTTDVGGTREILGDDDRAALLVPPGNSSALADAVIDCVARPPAAQERAAIARNRVQAHFTHRQAGDGLARHYLALALGGPAGGQISG